MSLGTGWTQLNSALKTIRVQWADVQNDWQDSVQESFNKDLWTPLEAQVVSTLQAMERLAPILAKAQQECE